MPRLKPPSSLLYATLSGWYLSESRRKARRTSAADDSSEDARGAFFEKSDDDDSSAGDVAAAADATGDWGVADLAAAPPVLDDDVAHSGARQRQLVRQRLVGRQHRWRGGRWRPKDH